jgi:hypothetical protein
MSGSNLNQRLLRIVLFFGVVIFVACSPNVLTISPNYSLNLPIADKIPLRAGIYVSQNTMAPISMWYYHDQPNRLSPPVVVVNAMSNAFDTIMDRSFKQVSKLSKSDLTATQENIDVIVIPELTELKYTFVDIGVLAQRIKVTLKMKWSIKDRNNKILYMNTFSTETIGDKREPIEKIHEKAITDNFNQAYLAITSSRWWQK